MSKKILALILIALILFSSVFLFLGKNAKTNIVYNAQKLFKNIQEELVDSKNIDNWELGIVFYDSTVDNGETALKEISWDASDEGYKDGSQRVITVQINYKNTNTQVMYNPGDLRISIPNLIYNTRYIGEDKPCWRVESIVGANDRNHSGYSWNFIDENKRNDVPGAEQENYIFTNDIIIEKDANSEGTIQIVYKITPMTEENNIEKYENECVHKYNKTLQADLNNRVKSNEICFDYTRIYKHPWQRRNYKVTETANKIKTYDGLGENADDYIWVKYNFKHDGFIVSYPEIGIKEPLYKNNFPEDVIVLDDTKSIFESVNGTYTIEEKSDLYGSDIYVGYPKNIYNEQNGNLKISNKVELWGIYSDDIESKYLADATITLNLNDFKFESKGEYYGITKELSHTLHNQFLRYQDIVKNGSYNNVQWDLKPTAYYSGTPMTLQIGDDVLYAVQNDENGITKLSDDEYYFSSIEFRGSNFSDIEGNTIEAEKYDCELWVRYSGENEYIKESSFKNPSNTKSWKNISSSKRVVAYYFIIKDMTDSVVGGYNGVIGATTVITKKDISESGTLYNFDYLKVYFSDGSLRNPGNMDYYKSFATKEEISKYDEETYGELLQRNTAGLKWSYYQVSQILARTYGYKWKSKSIIQDNENEVFKGSYGIGLRFGSYISPSKLYMEQYDSSYAIRGFRVYDLLPLGMELTSDEKEILESFSATKFYGTSIYDLNLNSISSIENIVDKSNIKVTRNWKETGRTRIEIITTFKEPIYICGDSSGVQCDYKYDYIISYDSYLEYGDTYDNICYADLIADKFNIDTYIAKDNGYFDDDVVDIDENGVTEQLFGYGYAPITITSVISTHQDLTKYVQTDQSNYTKNQAEASPGSEYTYKLRVRTGSNNLTNLVIYDSIEEYLKLSDGNLVTSYGDNEHWNGEFLGIDTSYAEKNGYKIKVYYSKNTKVGNLIEDDSWKEYSDSVDKSKVKSLAFEYLDAEGKPAILPSNSMTYVLIRLKAPETEELLTLAYGACWSQWNAIDEFGNTVDYITGVHSNTVKVSTTYFTEVTGTKIWKEESKSKRPENITINLLRDGNLYRTTTTNEEQGWNYSFSNLPLYNLDGSECVYTIEEVSVNHYITQYSDGTDKNASPTSGLSIKFSDKSKTEHVAYDYVEIYYKEDGEIYKLGPFGGTSIAGQTVKVPTNNFYLYWHTNWREGGYYGYSIDEIKPIPKESIDVLGEKSELPNFEIKEVSKNNYPESKHNAYGNDIDDLWHYSGQKVALIPEEGLYNIINIYDDNYTDISGTKTWVEDTEDNRPETISINLLQNGEIYKTTTTESSKDWKYIFEDVPVCDKDGNNYEYKVEEIPVESYITTYSETNKFDIINTFVKPEETEVTVQKVWDDYNNYDGIRPQTIQVQLYADENPYGEPISLYMKDDWKYTWTNLPKKHEGEDIKYTVKELGKVDGYEVSYSEDTFIITNTHEPKLSIQGKKTWEDNENQDGIRPENITINLFADGEKIDSKDITEKDEWEWTFENLPKYKNKIEIEYTITEENVENYTSKINGYDITNTHTPGETGRTVQKVWKDRNNQDGIRPESVEVQLLSDGEVYETVQLNQENEWKYTWEKLPEKKDGKLIKYTVKEIDEVSGYTTTYDNESFIIINTHEPEKITVSGSKVWDDTDNQDNLRPEKITINLFANGEKIQSKEITEEQEWKWTFENLDKYSDGKEIEYTITEDDVEGYVSQVEGYNITNTHKVEKVSVSGSKKWDDQNNQDGMRPEQIVVNLLANGQKIDSKTITEKDKWSWTFDNLDKYKEGTEIVYTITEDKVEGYETKVDGYNITNTHIHIEEEKTENPGQTIKPQEVSAPTEKVEQQAVTNSQPTNNNIITTNLSNNTDKVTTTITSNKIPNTGDILPTIAIGTIIIVIGLNIFVTMQKRKRKGKHEKI